MAFDLNGNTPKKIDLKFLTDLQNVLNVARVKCNGVTVWLQRILYTITGIPPLTANKSFGEPLVDYKIYGNSEQNGTPSIANPIEIKSVGDKVTDSNDANYGKYKIPVLASVGQNTITTNIYLDEPLRKINNYSDYIDFQNSKVVRNIYFVNNIIFSSSSYSSSSRCFLISLDFEPKMQTATRNPGCFSNKFDGTNTTYTYQGLKTHEFVCMPYINTSGAYRGVFRFDDSVKNYEVANQLIGNDLKFYYILETPIEETIELPEILTQEGANIISIGTEVQPSNMEIQYYGTKF